MKIKLETLQHQIDALEAIEQAFPGWITLEQIEMLITFLLIH